MGWKFPYMKCRGCSLKEGVESYLNISLVPYGERKSWISISRLEDMIYSDDSIPTIYSDFERHFCSDCKTYTNWFMCKYSNSRLIEELSEEDLRINNSFFESNPEIIPTCVTCGGHDMIEKPLHEGCGGQLYLEFEESGFHDIDMSFTEWVYLPNGRIIKSD